MDPVVTGVLVMVWLFGFLAGVLTGWFGGTRWEAKAWWRIIGR